MKNDTRIRKSLWKAVWTAGIAWALAAPPCLAQSAKVAENSVRITADATKKELAVEFRLVDDVGVTSVQAATEGKGEALPATWEAWEGDKSPACAWMIVVDTSNPARAKTVATGVEFVRSFLTGLPKQDKVAVFTLARDMAEVVPFGSSPADTAKGLTGIKPSGDASLTTLIYSNLRDGLARLGAGKGTRRAVLLLTDGKDETPGGPAAQEIEKQKLIDSAKSAGIAIHSVGYAESAGDQMYFAALKEISAQTDGLFAATSLANKDVPSGTLTLLRGVMHGAGTVHIDVSKLAEPAALTVTVKTAGGKLATLQVPSEKIVAALPPAVVAKPTDPKTGTPEEIKKAEEEKKAADGKAVADKAVADKAAADKAAADKAAADKAAADKKAAELKKRNLILAGSGLLLAILVIAVLMLRASRKRAEEQARLDEAARMAEEERAADVTRRAEAARRSEETKKTEAPPLAWLEMCDAQQTRHPIRITSLKIGRGQHNDFVLRNDSVSGNHCVLNCTREGEWSLTDLNSGNGVVLNGMLVHQAPLRHGDTIELGELKMRFLLRA